MLHTNGVHCSLALWVRQFEPECSNCVGHTHNGLCAGPRCRSSVLAVGQENAGQIRTGELAEKNNRRNAE